LTKWYKNQSWWCGRPVALGQKIGSVVKVQQNREKRRVMVCG
jgi:hypothetical protein